MKQVIKLHWLIAFIAITMTTCIKKHDGPSYQTTVRFTYNGQSYKQTPITGIINDLIFVQNEFLLVNFTGLEINDENNLFGGNIYILARNPGAIQCAFLRPTGSSVGAIGGDCSQLSSGGNPIDSTRVYWYESGNISFAFSDCKAVSNVSVAGQKDCAISGSFDLVLTNKNNQKIKLTNGSFSGRIRTYP